MLAISLASDDANAKAETQALAIRAVAEEDRSVEGPRH